MIDDEKSRLEVILEDINGKFDLVLEGHTTSPQLECLSRPSAGRHLSDANEVKNPTNYRTKPQRRSNKMIKVFSIIAVLFLAACSQQVDYSGKYYTTDENNCETSIFGKNIIDVMPVKGHDTPTYSAIIKRRSLLGDGVPAYSAESVPDEDGTITFAFIRPAQSNMFVNKPGLEMKFVLKGTTNGAWLTNVIITKTDARSGAIMQSVDQIERVRLETKAEGVCLIRKTKDS